MEATEGFGAVIEGVGHGGEVEGLRGQGALGEGLGQLVEGGDGAGAVGLFELQAGEEEESFVAEGGGGEAGEELVGARRVAAVGGEDGLA